MPKDKKKERRKDVAGRLAAVGGGLLAKDQYNKLSNMSESFNRTPLFHGTKKRNIPSILKDGLKKTTESNAPNTNKLKKIDEILHRKSLGKTYMTKNKKVAKGYGTTLNINLPLDDFKQVPNPEATRRANKGAMRTQTNLSEEQINEVVKKPTVNKEWRSKFKDHVVVTDDVAPKYIKDSKKYRRWTPKEMGRFAKNNPKKFALGAGATALGVAGVGYGGYRLFKYIKKEKDKKDMQKQAMVQLGLEKLAGDLIQGPDGVFMTAEDFDKVKHKINNTAKNIVPYKPDTNKGTITNNKTNKPMGLIAGATLGTGIGHLIDRKRDKENAKAGKIIGGISGAGLGSVLTKKASERYNDKATKSIKAQHMVPKTLGFGALGVGAGSLISQLRGQQEYKQPLIGASLGAVLGASLGNRTAKKEIRMNEDLAYRGGINPKQREMSNEKIEKFNKNPSRLSGGLVTGTIFGANAALLGKDLHEGGKNLKRFKDFALNRLSKEDIMNAAEKFSDNFDSEKIIDLKKGEYSFN